MIPTPPGFIPGPPVAGQRALGTEDNFLPYSGAPAVMRSGDGRECFAWLGSTNGDKDTFHVHTWWREKDGTITLIALDKPPPTNSCAFLVRDGQLIIIGQRGATPDEWVVPGFVAPVVPDAASIRTEIVKALGEPSKVAMAVVNAVVAQLTRK